MTPEKINTIRELVRDVESFSFWAGVYAERNSVERQEEASKKVKSAIDQISLCLQDDSATENAE